MNRWRIVGLVLLAALLAWFAVRSLMPEAPPPPPPEPVRETFHPAKPLHLEVRTAADPEALPAELRWLDRELRHLLARGKMNVAPIGGVDADAGSAAAPYTLRVTLSDDHTRAQVELVAPDRIVDKRADVALSDESQLATLQTFAQHLPSFLSAPGGTADWTAAPGTTDAAAYGEFLRAGDALLGPDGTGFTAPAPSGGEAAQRLEQLERLARRQRQFARARALLSLAYLSVGGEDEASLTKLAETAAERALALDAALADAQAALGIVRLRRMEWTAAQEHFDAALELDANSIPALEGLGCLLMDVGHVRAALPVALRSVALQPGNRGARECATYARIATGAETASLETESADTARIHAVMSLLAGDRAGAEALLRSGAAIDDGLARIIIEASGSKDRIPEALQAVTTSADDEAIDAETEILFGVALRRPDFVFNRMLRLAKQDEAVPLRVLWLPQTEFLRKHRRFREVVSTATLTTYWQDHGRPDVCESEPKVPGCAVKRN